MKYYKNKKQYAFTLLEVLISLSIIVLIFAAAYGSYRATITSISHCSPKSIGEQQARLFLQRITSELRCCYAGRLNQSEDGKFENILIKETTSKETEREESPLFTGKTVFAGKMFLQFATSSFASNPNRDMGGLAIISYKLDESGKVLLRKIYKYVEGFENENDNGRWFPVLSNVKSISFEYLENDKWQKEWKSEEGMILPQVVRISLVLETNETGPISFASSAFIMCSRFQNSGTIIKTITQASDL